MMEWSLFDLEKMLDSGELTSYDLVQFYLKRIAMYDKSGLSLNSIGEINPDVEIQAMLMDKERKENKKRSRLHGIPIILKDNINTRDDMHTSAGSLALEDLYAPYDATIVKKLRDAGMIILGKANLSEFAYFMSTTMPSGFSSRFGQVKSCYHENIDPSGSSTGSAVAVAANLIPVSLGTETNGSLISPAEKSSIVTLKSTLGLLSRYGIIPISSKQDTPGPMTRTVKESALLMNYLYGVDDNDIYTKLIPEHKFDFLKACDQTVNGLRLGFLSFDDRELDEEEQKIKHEAQQIFREAGCDIYEFTLKKKKIENLEALLFEFKNDLNRYLSTVQGYTSIKSLKDIIDLNKTNPEKYMPYGQDLLVKAQQRSGLSREKTYIEAREEQLRQANLLLDKMNELGLDVVVTVHGIPHTAINGCPSLSVPAKSLIDDKPINLVFSSRHWQDELLFSVAHYYESKTHYRTPPCLYREFKN